MTSGICDKTYLVELDEDFKATGNKEKDEDIRRNILARIGIPKTENVRPVNVEESTDSDEEDLSERKFDILLDPECGYACEKDIGWFDMVQSKAPWDESRRPYEQILKYEDLTLTDAEKQGILSGMIISTGLNILDTIPMTDGFALTKLQLSDKGLKDIQILDAYKYLQYLDLSYNSIEDLSPLEQSTYLSVLDVSHNQISVFKPNPTPWFLTFLNLSFNKFETVPDVSSMWSLKHLNLSNNQIKKIEGIENLNYLEYLNMCHNNIEIIENISKVPLKTLDLSWNEITHCIEPADETGGLKNITTLQRLDVSHNKIESMYSISCINPVNLRHLNIAYNKFGCVTSFDDLTRFKALRYLRIEGNKLIQELPEIVKNIMHLLPQLDYINGSKLSKMERLIAYSMWNSNAAIQEMKKYCYDLLYSNVEPPGYGMETPKHLDYDIPIVILVGPNGCRKNLLARCVAKKYPHYVKTPIFHTTVYQYTNFEDVCEEFRAMELCHVSEAEFNQMWNRGKFLFVHGDLGDLYGVSRDELEDDGRLILIPLNIGPALSLTWQGLNTTLILIQPSDDTDYSELLQMHLASIMSIHKERDALKEIKGMEEQPRESVAGEGDGENEEEDDEEQTGDDFPLGGPLGSRYRSLSAGKLRKSASESKLISNMSLKKVRIGSKSSLKNQSSQQHSSGKLPSTAESDSRVFKVPSIETNASIEFELQKQYPSWCDDESEEEEPEEEIEMKKYVPYIDTLKTSQAEKDNLWNLYEIYYNERKSYYEEIGDHLFSQTVVVDDVGAATKKILRLLIEKYNSRLTAPKVKKEKDELYDVLVKPRLEEMMEILADRGVVERFDTLGALRDETDISSSEASKETLSVPFFSKSTSSLNVTPSTSLTEYGTEEKRLEEPEHFWAPRRPPSPLSTRSSALEEIAKSSVTRAGYDLQNLEKTIRYSKQT